MTGVFSICLFLAALSVNALGPPQPIFFDFPPPPPKVTLKAESPPASLSRHGRRLVAYERAVAFIRAEKFDEALKFIQKQTLEVKSWPALAALEAGLSSAAKPAESLALYERILKDSPKDRYWVRALAGYRALLRDLSQKGDYLARARLVKLLAEEWRNVEAMSLLDATLADLNLPTAARRDLEAFRAVLALRVGDFAAAEGFWADKPDVASRRYLAALRVRQGRFAEAADIRLEIAELLKGEARLKELARAFDALTKGGFTQKALELIDKEGDLKKRLASWSFYLGLSALIAKDPEAAEKYFTAEENQPGAAGTRALYFKGRSLEARQSFAAASSVYQKARDRKPGYYQLLAAGRYEFLNDEGAPKSQAQDLIRLLEGPRDQDSLGFYLWLSDKVSWPWPDLLTLNPKKSGPGEATRTRAAIVHYLKEGDWPMAAAELAGGAEVLVPKKPEFIDEDQSRFILLAALSGDYRLAIRFLSQVKSKGAPSPYRVWLHPLVYGQPVIKAFRLYGIEPQKTLSVIRVESAFQVDAVSASNARGLMQILPSTAKSIAASVGDPEPREEDLFDPALNIRYGTWYLNELNQAFGQWPLALAAYNGGPFNVKSYLMARLGLSLDVFIETLPLPETIRYVQSALESQFVYDAAYLGVKNYPNLTNPIGPLKKEPPAF
ncbi:MAG: transglycosylase SLT domain-containing protein [Deltaproteobacteria bacterium]|nr:transglycosylase SLT domain-containing protein [Deltaproteobacteria bacterium]